MWPCTFTGVAYALLRIGSLAYLFNVRWCSRSQFSYPCSRNVHRHKSQLQHLHGDGEYWNKERRYSILGSYLRLNHQRAEIYGNYDYLIDTYIKDLTNETATTSTTISKPPTNSPSGNITKTGEIVNLISSSCCLQRKDYGRSFYGSFKTSVHGDLRLSG